jgi:ATP-dependent helicase YprA (DUF1998 family)
MAEETNLLIEATIRKMSEHKPEWFTSHEKSDIHEFGEIRATLKSQDTALAELKKNQEEQRRSLDELIKMQKEYHEATLPVIAYLNRITVGEEIRSDYIKMTGVWTGVILGVSAVA